MGISFDKALLFAASKHSGQKDKGDNSYMLHVLRVTLRMQSEDEMIVALLHDVVEDTNATLEDLAALGCTEAQLMAIDALTKKEGQTEEEYLSGILKSTVAKKVKIADIEDNTAIWRLKNRANLAEKDLTRLSKYGRMWSRLNGL